MDFLPYILSAESSGPRANQTRCHSVSHFVQFHVLFPWKEENYFDRLKPFSYWNGLFVSFSRLLSTVSSCLPGREALISPSHSFLSPLALQGFICRMRGTLAGVENGRDWEVTCSPLLWFCVVKYFQLRGRCPWLLVKGVSFNSGLGEGYGRAYGD